MWSRVIVLRCAFSEGCACALCWSPWQGLGAKTRLSRLVLNFLPSAPALCGLPSSPCRALGGGGTRGVGGLAELSAPTDWTLPPNPHFFPPPSSFRHLLTRLLPEQPPAPAPNRARVAPSAASLWAFSGSHTMRPTTPLLGPLSRASGKRTGEGGG